MTTTETPTGITGSANAHARLSPSDSKRWTQCSASIAYQEANSHRIRKDNGSVYSNKGTEAHEWAAELLLGNITPEQIPDEFRDPVVAYVEHCKALTPEGVKYQVEVSCPLYYQPTQNGTCDFAIITQDRVTVRDLKFGGGVLVTSFESTQLSIYGYSLIKLLEDVYDFTPDTVIDFAVFQPNHREGAEQPAWITTLGDLAVFCQDIEYRAIQARTGADRVRDKLPCGERDITPKELLEAAPGVKFHPEEGDGGSCRWCSCKAFCPARMAAIEADLPIGMPLQDLLSAMPDLTKPESKLPAEERVEIALTQSAPDLLPITDDLMVALYSKRKAIKSVLDDIEEYLEQRALDGNPANGTALVLGREGNRAWADETAADTFLAGQKIPVDDRFTKKLISPTQAEKLLKDMSPRAKSRYEQLVTRSAAKQVLALSDDKRETVPAKVDLMPQLD